MKLTIEFICPECNKSISIDFEDLSPGRRQTCQSCQTPAYVTPATLKQFCRDVQLYCKS